MVFNWVSENQNQTNYLPIILLGQSWTVVKLKPKPKKLPDYCWQSIENQSTSLSLVSIWSSESFGSFRSSQSSQKVFRRSGQSYGNTTQTIANDPDRFKIYTIVPIVRIELNSIQVIEVVSVVRVVCDHLGSVSIWSSRSSEHFFWDDPDDPDNHMETRLYWLIFRYQLVKTNHKTTYAHNWRTTQRELWKLDGQKNHKFLTSIWTKHIHLMMLWPSYVSCVIRCFKY